MKKRQKKAFHSACSLVCCLLDTYLFPPEKPSFLVPAIELTGKKKYRMTMSSITPDTIAQPSLHEWRSSSSNHHHRARSRLRCIPCGRCHAVIQHDSRAPWSVVNKLVNMHWDACPGKPHVLLAQIPPPLSVSDPSPPSAPLPPPSSIPPPVGGPGSTSQTLSVKKDGDGGREFAGPTRTGPSVTSAGWERKRKTEEQRKKELEEDEYAEHVTAISVVCVGCRKQISLDKRSRYYPGLWVKHKNKCPDVDRLKVRTTMGRLRFVS